MLGPHIFGGSPLSSRNSLDQFLAVGELLAGGFLLQEVSDAGPRGLGLVFRHTAILRFGKSGLPSPATRAACRVAFGPMPCNSRTCASLCLRQLRECREPAPCECAPRGRRQLRHESVGGPPGSLAFRAAVAVRSLVENVALLAYLALPHHTSFAYWMNPKFFATLS